MMVGEKCSKCLSFLRKEKVMKQFCTECGKEAKAGDNVCIHCGTPLQKEQSREPQVTKQPMSKKQKIIFGPIAGVVLFIIAFSVWANNYQAPDAVMKRYIQAVDSSDSKKLSKLMIREDGTPVSTEEAESYLKLVKDSTFFGEESLYSVVQHGKFLGVY